jgi:hypothetical protein
MSGIVEGGQTLVWAFGVTGRTIIMIAKRVLKSRACRDRESGYDIPLRNILVYKLCLHYNFTILEVRSEAISKVM